MTSLLNNILLTLFLLLQFSASAQVLDKDGIPEKPSPPRLLNDFAEMISTSKRQLFEDKLVAFNDSTSTQICVVTVNSIEDYSIEDYAVRLGRKWGVGQKDKDNGILILVAKDERKVDIEIGYGLESYITDYDTKNIIDEIIVPAFKQSNYYEGLDLATNRIIAQLQGTYSASSSAPATESSGISYIIIIIVIIFIVIIIISGSSSGTGGGLSGGSGWTWSSGGGSSWSGGGSSGGFSGFGGGSFGGGGSSGSW
ncbi:MAG TPA: TPM domain-containing protein [Chitinophagales bacterium]|jgi:uncharacterized protein|nr:TPM domain-containing protein [Chitinophagales bacterium]